MMNPVDRLQQHFASVATGMADLPVSNPALVVECVGFQAWAERQIGVLITPWCMNLILLPGPGDHWAEWEESQIGRKLMLALPSGQYEWIYNRSDNTGGYLSCSLFSPMNMFSEQAIAVETAEEVMRAVFDTANESLTDRQQAVREQIAQTASEQETVEVQEEEKSPATLSRRGFLTAGFARTEE